MFTMITSEEYKELVLAKEENTRLLEELKYADEQLRITQNNLKELLLLLTNGKTSTIYGELQSFEIITDTEIAKYINKNYLAKGTLKFTKIKENNNE